ncbi:hypothetical protein CVT24_008683 [Panaeolus cyanescens]|uniref:Major facilitator superfamily (MFS) profile domain-containing protein n=1 Tax=Panaeolus cyanescens TaxID=181874 RepID=A0A409VKN0_9AGAR|nr:hypothetical protein CVT24_008683 [Panaeolus cyanescens]
MTSSASNSSSHERRPSDIVIFSKKLDDSRVLASKRQAALAEIDNAKFSYDIFAINVAAVMLGYVYGTTTDKKLPYVEDLGLKIATPVGTLVGQILFGWLADLWGRKKMYGIELMIMIVSTFAQAISAEGQAVRIIPVLIIWRFIMGVGIGGDYPLSAIMASEFASKKIRGRMMVSIFACQGWGNIAAVLVAFTLTNAYKNAIKVSTPDTFPSPFDPMWRLLIGIGCIPAAVALYFRLTIPETPRFTMDIECNIQQATRDINTAVGGSSSSTFSATSDYNSYSSGYGPTIERIHLPKATWKDFKDYFGKSQNFKILFGTAYSWFALDVVFYGLNLNSAYLLTAIGFSSGNDPNVSEQVKRYLNLNDVCIGNLILAAGGLIPGYWASFFFVDSWGRKPIQLMGFTVLTILFIIMGAAYPLLIPSTSGSKSPGFVFLYCLTNFFTNFGPNVTTFIIPGEIFPTRYRSTAHGFSAGMGKLGAILGQVVISELRKDHPEDKDLAKVVRYVFMIFAIFMITGIFSTWFLLPETKKKTLEELSNEDQDVFVMKPRHRPKAILSSFELSHERFSTDIVILNRSLDNSRELGEIRRAALSEIDNAKFSWVFPNTSLERHWIEYLLQLVSCASLHRGWNGIFHGRVCGAFLSTMIILFLLTAEIVSSIVSFVLVQIYQHDIQQKVPTTLALDRMWRILIGFGCVPAVVALYFRLTIPETPRFTMDIECNIRQATRDINMAIGDSSQSTLSYQSGCGDSAIERIHLPKATWKDFLEYFRKEKNFQVLFATAYSWFALDVVFYGMVFNNPSLVSALGHHDKQLYGRLRSACESNILLAATSLIPGYYASLYFIDSWGRKPIQLMGFMVLAILFIIMGAAYPALLIEEGKSPWLVLLYCLTNFFTNFGPNVTTFVIPGEVFPTRYRSTCHGLSAGMGKLGAIVGQIVITVLSGSEDLSLPPKYLRIIFGIFAAFMVTGAATTWFLLPETKKRTLEELSNEDQDLFVMSTSVHSDFFLLLIVFPDGFTSSRRITQNTARR